MKKFTKIFTVIALCAVMVVMSVVPAFAATNDVTYIENHSKVDCANYYLDNMYYYKFLIKVPNGTPLDCVTIRDIYGGYKNLGDMTIGETLGSSLLEFEYSNQDGDFYMFTLYLVPGLLHQYWEQYGIKVYYDNGNEHYMATNTANGSTTEGPGYILKRQ